MNTPPFGPDDPRLTAYALGETDEADRQAVEKMLAESAQGRVEVEQTKAIAHALTVEYAREHERYLASQPEAELPSKIVTFRNGRNRSWQRAAILTLKVAAVAALTASLVYLTLRRPRRPEDVTVASAPPTGRVHASAPAPDVAEQVSKDKAVAARDGEKSDARQASASDQPRVVMPTTAPAAPTANAADSSLAIVRAGDSDKFTEQALDTPAAEAGARTDSAAPVNSMGQLKVAPGAASSAATASSLPSKPVPSDDRIASSLVRVRTAAGAFFGGVLVSTDGLILATTALPDSALQQPCTVFLADQRVRSAVARHANLGSGWFWLHIDATALPAAALATDVPADDSSLTFAHVDPQTGSATFSRVPPAEATEVAAFAFNLAGELLVIGPPSQQSRTARRAKTEGGGSAPRKPAARPFTPAERAILRQAAERTGGN